MSEVDIMRYFDEIAKKAQELFMENGRTQGRDLDIWLEAERIVMVRQLEQEKNVEEKGSVKRPWIKF
ncbi:MAG: hypothetical protein A2Y97_04200 [Nitrospirae bacterium RBG_13_39_12]|nr:MAG: hypothetical protein A2Y97_04200 [Nitrospirae bacterium RBG_13_39_12]